MISSFEAMRPRHLTICFEIHVDVVLLTPDQRKEHATCESGTLIEAGINMTRLEFLTLSTVRVRRQATLDKS